MDLYSDNELKRIKLRKEANDNLEEFFKDKREKWNKNIEPLFEVLALEMGNPSNSKKVLEAQSLALSYKQRINDQINFFLNKRSNETAKLKKLKQEKFLHYAINFQVKTNMGEKRTLIEGHIAENQRAIETIDAYIDYLRDCSKNLESFGYSIKNMIELLNYLGR